MDKNMMLEEDGARCFLLTPTFYLNEFIANAYEVPGNLNEYRYTYEYYHGGSRDIIYKYKSHYYYNIWRKIEGNKVTILLLFEYLPKKWHYPIGSFMADDEAIAEMQKCYSQYIYIIGGEYLPILPNRRNFNPYRAAYCYKIREMK